MTFGKQNLHAEFITTSDSFADLQAEWDELLVNSLSDNPFLSHQWLRTWWDVYGNGDLQLLTIRDVKKQLVGILPLFRIRVLGVPPVTMLRYLGSSSVSTDFLDCIVRNGWEEKVFETCVTALQRAEFSWDILLLQDMDQNSKFCKYLVGSEIRGLEVSGDIGKVCPYLQLPSSWQMLLNGLSKKVRQRVGYYRRALERFGTIEIEQIFENSDLSQAIADMIKLRKDRLNQKKMHVSTVSVKYIQFHEILTKKFLQCNRLRLYFLKINNERIAYMYLFAGNETVYFYQTGFNREWGRSSVGFVLLGMVIEQSILAGCRQFEFLRGDESYKFEWGDVRKKHLIDVVIPSGVLGKIWLLKLNFWRNLRHSVNQLKYYIMKA